jgi:hypothetical protein
MTSFEFFRPQTVFIGGWGTKFIFFRTVFEFFGPQTVKKQSNLYSNSRFRIQTVEFEFKWTNQEATPHYRPSAPVAGGNAGGSARPGSNAGSTARSDQAVALPPARHATSVGW